MIIELKKILDVEKPLSEMMQQQLPIGIAFKISKLIRAASEQVTDFLNLRTEYIKRLGEEQPNGDYLITDEQKKLEFTEQLTAMLDQKVDLIGYEPISMSEFAKVDIKISPYDMLALQEFFTE